MQASAMSGLRSTAWITSRAMSRNSLSALCSLRRFCSKRSSWRLDWLSRCSTDGGGSGSANSPAISGASAWLVSAMILVPELNFAQSLQRECQGLIFFCKAEADDARFLALLVKRRYRYRRHLDLGGQPLRKLHFR